MEFLTERNDNAILFPRPGDGAIVRISPPSLTWLPAEGASSYRVEIRRDSGEVVYEKDVGRDPVHLPDQTLEPGTYT